jgi:choline dehydrogenase-like flavoprotein
VIGAGAAGLALVDVLGRAGLRVLLVDTGSARPSDRHQELNRAKVTGLPYDSTGSRARAFGGTLHLWAGRCGTLDPIDFERRDWVADSGWPIGPADLKRHYDGALAFLGHPAPDYFDRSPEAFSAPSIAAAPGLEIKDFLVTDHVDGRFCAARRRRLAATACVDVAESVTAQELVVDEHGRVTGLRCCDSRDPGREVLISADRFVVCAGGLETPRLLLASRARQATGLGNGRDLVGRYFSDHPRLRSAGFQLPPELRRDPTFVLRRRKTKKSQIGLRFADTLQRRHGLSNHCVMFGRRAGDIEALATTIQSTRNRSKAASGPRAIWRRIPTGPRRVLAGALAFDRSRTFVLTSKIELRPNRDSRLTIGADRDRLGMPRIEIDWRIASEDREGLRRYFALLGTELRSLGLVERSPDFPDPDRNESYRDSSHPLGTTRMGATAREGVVDADLRVFSTSNLYLCGSSVFPTGGNVNPTLTIIALALRLAEHLLRSGVAGAQAQVAGSDTTIGELA